MGRERLKNDAGFRDPVGCRFIAKTRYFEDGGVVAFIDLLGTRELYDNTLAKDQASAIADALLGQFDITFSRHFRVQEFEDNFDISIFADSIAISPRKRTPESVEPLVEFLLDYQGDLLIECEPPEPSRAICTNGSFFSLRLENPSDQSILCSQHTTISLCGGGSVRFAHDCLKGLPIGVYVTDRIRENLSAEQRARLVPVRSEGEKDSLSFIKRKDGIDHFIPSATRELLSKKPEAGRRAVMDSIRATPQDQNLWKRLQQRHSLRAYFTNEDALDKWASWIWVHLGKENEIIRSDRPPEDL